MNNENIEVRKLPKKTIYLIAIMVIITIIGFLFVMETKTLKMEEVLKTMGYKNISKLIVGSKIEAENKETKIKSTVYKVSFFDKDLNKSCFGFIIKSNQGKYTKDLDCK